MSTADWLRLGVAFVIAGAAGALACWLCALVGRWVASRVDRRVDRHVETALAFSPPAPPCPTADVLAHPDLAELDAVFDRLYLI